MDFDAQLLFRLLAILGLMQAACWLLARGLGRRIERHVIALGIVLPLALLFPWLGRSRLLVPTGILQEIVPGAPSLEVSRRHDLLNDAVFQFLPWELEVRHALAERRLPLWSDTLEGGSSPWVNPQAAPLSPIAMPARAVPIQHHLLATLALKLLVAFEGAWLLARSVGVSRPSSLLAAAGFALGGALMPWALFPHTAAVAWVPWLATGVIRLFRGGGGRTIARSIPTTAILTAALLLSGHPETAAIGGLFAALCGLWLRARRRSFARGLGAAALAAALGFGLAAPQILPFALHLPGSQRAQETLAKKMPDYYLALSVPLTWFLPGYGKHMLAPLGPAVYGRPYQDEFRGPFNWADADSGYAGLVAFAGAAVALAGLARPRRLRPFLFFGILSLLLAAQFLPLAHVIYAVPSLRTLAWSRFLLVGSLGLAIAGGFGLDRLLFRRRGRAVAFLGLAIAAALSLLAHADPWTVTLWVLLGASAALAWRWPRLAAAGLGLALLLDLGPWARAHLPSGEPALFFPSTDLLAQVRQEVDAPGGPWRVAGEGQTLYPSVLPVYGIADVRPHNPLAPMTQLATLDAAFGFAPSLQNYFPAFGNVDHPFLDFLNARVVASTIGYAPPRTLERIDGERYGPYRLYRNPGALPRWFLPTGVDVIGEGEVRAWVARLADPRRVAVFDERARGWVGGEGGAVTALAMSRGRLELAVPGAGDRLLATSLLEPGWRGEAAGRRLETLTVNGAFLGLGVPAGVDRIALLYRPPGFRAGVAVGLVALAAVIAGVARALRPWAARQREGRW